MARITANIDVGKVVQRMKSMANNGLAAASEQALSDSNFYAPKQYGFLIASSETNSDIKGGKLQWVTPYARRLYYQPGIKIKRGKNPNATQAWADVAKAAHFADWVAAFKKGMK